MKIPLIRCRTYCSSVPTSANSQIAFFSRLGQIENARKVFDQIPQKNIISWNSIIAGYFQNNQPTEARRLFDLMPERNTVSWNGLISGYVKNRMVKEARKVFDTMPVRDVVSWTAMVRGYVEEGWISVAESLFWKMPEKNVISWMVMLGGLIRDRRIDEARELFDEMPCRNVDSWTTMVSGYVQNQRVDIARKLFEVMPEKNEVTWTAMLMGYTQCGRIVEASELFDAMPTKSVIACNAMILGLGQNGEVFNARKVFDQMREKDDRTWSAMIKVYERKGFELEALDLFALMQRRGFQSNFPSLISILSVCASLRSLDHGRQVHAQMLRSQFDSDVHVSSALITMYIKCGDLVKAKWVFDGFSPKDIIMWNSIVTGYAQHGLGEEALQVFHEMCSSGIATDDITFVGVLSACSRTGKVKEGLEIFESMKDKYLVDPSLEHYACMVDLLGQAGQLKQAMDFIEKMPFEPDCTIWGSILGACRMHKNLDLAEVAVKKLLQLGVGHGQYTLLPNISAPSRGRWAGSMKVSKSLRCSWIEVEKKVHMFTGGEIMPHPQNPMIVRMLEKLDGLLREAGYSPDGSFEFHDVS
ncbi:hypothetical protein Vadar_012643 [Vaccinium darrowii]|uniref:Uncharacterized protein n=1 Tax=Vaccinium darrowii TaxID=229202 RepID=A0ACB7X0H5_9ERIC|nr:hypothetical protein Vadar_012643 [Vaccinium darrowii]